MELDFDLKQKLTERILGKFGEPEYNVTEEIYNDLLDGEHSVNIMTTGRYTIADVEYYRNGYCHHFLGVSARNPNDDVNEVLGIKAALEDSITKLLSKFLFEEFKRSD